MDLNDIIAVDCRPMMMMMILPVCIQTHKSAEPVSGFDFTKKMYAIKGNSLESIQIPR